jgi:peptide/nickel transport system ATP-binding protein
LRSIPRLDVPRDEELVPIPGRPPSLINRPGGCHFHPRCPYVRESHKVVDPELAGDGAHQVRCLLPAETRRRLWAELRGGATPEEARTRVPIPEEVSP